VIFRKLKILSDEEMMKIVEGAFRILKNTGCRFDDEKCMDELEKQGCNVNRDLLVARFSEEIIFDALDNMASLTPLDDRPKARVASATARKILDYKTKKMRPGLARDVRDVILLCNNLKNITMASAGVMASDVPEGAIEVYNTGILFKYSEKLFNQWITDPDSVEAVFEIAKIITGSEERLSELKILSCMLDSTSPLTYLKGRLKIAREYARLNLPVAICAAPQTGVTAPASLAGCLVLCVAEMLAGLVWLRALDTKSPVALGHLAARTDPVKGRRLSATPEHTLMNLGAHQIIRYLGYTAGISGFSSDSCDFDLQMGWEKAVSGVLSWAAGCDMLGRAGMIADGFSIEQLALEDEVLDMLYRVGEGCVVDDDALALEVVKKVGPGGNFLAERHTLSHARDFWTPKIFSRKNYSQWTAEGKKTVADTAHEKVSEIISKKSLSLQIPEDKAKAIDEIVGKRIEKLGGSLKGGDAL